LPTQFCQVLFNSGMTSILFPLRRLDSNIAEKCPSGEMWSIIFLLGRLVPYSYPKACRLHKKERHNTKSFLLAFSKLSVPSSQGLASQRSGRLCSVCVYTLLVSKLRVRAYRFTRQEDLLTVAKNCDYGQVVNGFGSKELSGEKLRVRMWRGD